MPRWLLIAVTGWVIEASSPVVRGDLDAAAPRLTYFIEIRANADAFPSVEEAAGRGWLRVSGSLVNSRSPALASVVEVRATLTHDETGLSVEASHLIDAALSTTLTLELPWIDAPCAELPGCSKSLTLVLELVEPALDDTVGASFRATATLEGEPRPAHRDPRLEVEVTQAD